MNFDDTASEYCHWTFRAPDNYASAPVVQALYKMTSSTSGSIVLAASMLAVIPSSSCDTDVKTYGVGASTISGVPASAGYLIQAAITIADTNGLTACGFCAIKFGRLSGAGSPDTATGDAEIIAADLEYVTT